MNPRPLGQPQRSGIMAGLLRLARGDATGLSQQHLCFTRQDGASRIAGYFTYGL